MWLQIDEDSEDAIYMQLRNQIILAIAREELKDGDVMPSVRQLAQEIGVNMHTVNKTYSLLKREGFLQVDHRKGTVICIDREECSHRKHMHGMLEMMVAEAICKDISLEEMQNVITTMYMNFSDKDQKE